jgi:hypothetical protein
MAVDTHTSRETETQRWNRNYADLLQELRVAQTLPFSSGFPNVTAFQKDVYTVALISAAFATAMIISPVAFHRALFRQGRKPELVKYAHKMATGGLAFMLIAMTSSVLLITDYLLDWQWAIPLTAITGGWFLTYWVILPFAHREWGEDDEDEQSD